MLRHSGQPTPPSPHRGRAVAAWRRYARLARDRRAVTAVEYGVMAALIASALVAGIKPLRTGLMNEFTHISDTMAGNSPGPSPP